MATLRIGTLDLSTYLDVQQGSGMDPADPQFSERVFSHSLLKEGATLALTDLKEKEMVFPLFLRAASKDLLNGLVQQINFALDISGQTVTFQDDGSSQATTFDLISGQLDIEYDFRRAQNNYLHAKLRLFTQPLGYTGTRMVATAASTGPLQVLTIPSVAGDQPAQIVAQISGTLDQNTVGVASTCRFVALSVLPGPSYNPIFNASQIFSGGAFGNSAVIAAASGDPAYQGMFLRLMLGATFGPGQPVATLSAAAYPGRNRVLMIGRPVYPTGATAPMATPFMQLFDTFSNGNPTITLFPGASAGVGVAQLSTQWRMYDMGTFRFPTGPFPTTPNIAVTLTQPVRYLASQGIDVTALIVLPDDSTAFIAEPQNLGIPGVVSQPPGATYVLDDTQGIVRWFSMIAGGPFQADMTPYTRGNIPRVHPGAPAYVAAMQFGELPNDFTKVTVSIRERVRYLF